MKQIIKKMPALMLAMIVTAVMLLAIGTVTSQTAYAGSSIKALDMDLTIEITGNSSTLTYNAGEQFVTGYSVRYKVGSSDWTETAPAGVSVDLKSGLEAKAKGKDVYTYKMGLTADSFNIDPGSYMLGTVTVNDGILTIDKAPLIITAYDQTYVYNGYDQGEADPAYSEPEVIAKKVLVDGLKGSDVLTTLILTGTANKIGEYPGRIEITGVAVGEYGIATNNYKITLVPGKITITGIPLNVTITGSCEKRAYNGKEQTYQGTVTATSNDAAFDVSKFHYTGNVVVKGTEAGEYITQLTAKNCKYDDPLYELKCTIGDPIRLTITGKPEPAPVPPQPQPQPDTGNVLLAQMTAKGSSSLVLSWTKVSNADGYDVFFDKCSRNGACRKAETISNKNTLTWTKGGLEKKSAYRAYVKAWSIKDGKKSYIKTSPKVHAYTSGSTKNYTNPKRVTVKKEKVSLTVGKKYKIKAKVKKINPGKKLLPKRHEAKLRYMSSDKSVATVNKSGKITARGIGSCDIYVYAANGVSQKVRVDVK